jgi:tetratricopeptide (TPR) repeat protein
MIFENYPLTGRGWYLPCFMARTIGRSINETKGISRGEEIWISPHQKLDGAAAFDAFQVYFTARMYWGGKEQDVAALLDEYCRLLYGPAAEQMKAFFDYCELHWQDMERDKQKADTALRLFEEAKAKLDPSSIEARRLALLDKFLDGLRTKSKQLGQKRGVVPKLRLVGEAKGIVIDGRLDEPFWKTINLGSVGRLRELQTGRPPALGTTVMAGWYGNNLYFGIRCQEVPGEKPNVTTRKHDDPAIWYGDVVEILLETNMHSYYQIAVNAAGAVADLDRAVSKDSALNWDSRAEVATEVAEDHWTIEIRIPVTEDENDPLHMVVGRPPTQSLPWYVNICRQRVRHNGMEHSAFSPTGKSDFHHPLSFAHLYAGRSHTFEADPTVTNYLTALRTAAEVPPAEALKALVALVEGSHGELTDLQRSHALKLAAAAARSLKDYARAEELTARIPLEAERKNAIMLHLLAQRKAEELIDRFGSEDFTKWPFWAAGEAYATRGQAYLALGQQAKAQADLKAALALTSDPRTREKLLQTLQKLSPKQ